MSVANPQKTAICAIMDESESGSGGGASTPSIPRSLALDPTAPERTTPMVAEYPTSLYRYYDDRGALIYVGITGRGGLLAVHIRGQHLPDEINVGRALLKWNGNAKPLAFWVAKVMLNEVARGEAQ